MFLYQPHKVTWTCAAALSSVLTTQSLLLSLKASLPNHPNLQRFMDHCCRKHHYSFEIRKCGSGDCDICSQLDCHQIFLSNSSHYLTPHQERTITSSHSRTCLASPLLRSTDHPSTQRNRGKHFHSQPVYNM